MDHFTNKDGSKVFVLLDYNSKGAKNTFYSVWFGTAAPLATSITWNQQKFLMTNEETCYSVRLYTKDIAFVNCVNFKSTLTTNKKDVLFSLSKDSKSPVDIAVTTSGKNFDSDISDMSLRRIRFINLQMSRYVMLFSSGA